MKSEIWQAKIYKYNYVINKVYDTFIVCFCQKTETVPTQLLIVVILFNLVTLDLVLRGYIIH